MMSEKYKLIRVDERHHNGESGLELPTYRLMATRTIHLIDGRVVEPGELGGFVDNADCLSHEGNCWIADNARAYGNTVVRDDALAKDDAVLGNPRSTKDGATLSGQAVVAEHATVAGSSVEDKGRVSGHSQVRVGSLVGGRSSVYQFAQLSSSTTSDEAVARGAVKLFNSRVMDRAFAMGEAELENCTVRDRAMVKGFVRAKNVDVTGFSHLADFATAIAHTDAPRRQREQVVIRGQFSGTADAVALRQDGEPRLHNEGQTLFMEPSAFAGSVHAFLQSDAAVIDDDYLASHFLHGAPDEVFDAEVLRRSRVSATLATRECGAPTSGGTPCSQRVSPDAQECRAGHKVAAPA